MCLNIFEYFSPRSADFTKREKITVSIYKWVAELDINIPTMNINKL